MSQTTNVHPINESVKVSQPPSPPKTQKPKPTEALPTNRMTFEKQMNLLRAYATAYAHFGRSVTVKEVADVAGLLPDTASTANAFFIDVGLLLKNDTKFTPSNELVSFNHAFQWSPESASLKLAPLFQNMWFAKRILPKLLMGRLSEEEAITELASACSASPDYKLSIKTLLDYLNEVGLIRRDNGSIFLGNASTSSVPTNTEKQIEEKIPQQQPLPINEPVVKVSEPIREPQRPTVPPINQTAGTIQFSINVKVDMAEFAGWDGDRIAKFFAGIAQVLAAKSAADEQ